MRAWRSIRTTEVPLFQAAEERAEADEINHARVARAGSGGHDNQTASPREHRGNALTGWNVESDENVSVKDTEVGAKCTAKWILYEWNIRRHEHGPDGNEQFDQVGPGLEYPLADESESDESLDRAGEAIDPARAAKLRYPLNHLRIDGDGVPLLRRVA